jgi:hypothetical protein
MLPGTDCYHEKERAGAKVIDEQTSLKNQPDFSQSSA